MAAYVTLSQMVDRYGTAEVLRAADRDGDGVADTEAVERAIADATEEIDSYLSRRYKLPLVTVPGLVARIAGDIVMYRLSADPGSYTEEKRERYEDAVRQLKALASGDTLLPAAAVEPPTASPATAVDVISTSEARQWTRSRTGGVW